MDANRRRFIGGALGIGMAATFGSAEAQGAHAADAEAGFDLPAPGQGIAVSPSGRRIAVLYAFGVGIDVFTRDGALLRSLKRSGPIVDPATIAFLDGEHVVAPASSVPSSDAMVQVWAVADGAAGRTIDGPAPGGGSLANLAKTFALSADGKCIAALCDLRAADSVVIVDTESWQVRTVALRPMLARFDRIMSVALDADRLAVGTTGGRAVVFDRESGATVRDIQAYPSGAADPAIGVGALAFGADRTTLATGRSLSVTADIAERYGIGPESADGLKVWSLANGSLLRAASPRADPARQLVFDDATGTFAAAFNGRLVFAPVEASRASSERAIDTLSSIAVFRGQGLVAALGGRKVHLLTQGSP